MVSFICFKIKLTFNQFYYYLLLGDYIGDDILLKSPDDDKSMFERIKSSVKEFLTRPVSTQVCFVCVLLCFIIEYWFRLISLRRQTFLTI